MSEKKKTISKSDLIKTIAIKQNIPTAYVKMVMDALPVSIAEELKNGNKVQWFGFGTFDITERKERSGRNPKTGEPIIIAASKSVKFRKTKGFLN